MNLPSRIKDLPIGDERRTAATRFYLAIAAAHVCPNCTIRGLAEAAGIPRNYLYNISRGDARMSLNTAIAIERACGRDVVSRADLMPEIFDYENENGAAHVE